MKVTFIRDSDNERFVFTDQPIGYSLDRDITILDHAPIETASYNYASADGGYAVNQVRRPREIEINGWLLPEIGTSQNIASMRAEALRYFLIRETYHVVYENRWGEQFVAQQVVITDGAHIEIKPSEKHATFLMNMLALDPNLYAYAEDAEGRPTYTSSVVVPKSEVTDGGRVWENALAVWEDGLKTWTTSGTGVVTVDVATIVPVSPVIELSGLAVEPEIINLTTNTSIKFNGTVDAGKTLVIDCYNKTAKLDGANVVDQIEGDWLQIVNGQNKFEFTMTSGDATEATLKWNEVIG